MSHACACMYVCNVCMCGVCVCIYVIIVYVCFVYAHMCVQEYVSEEKGVMYPTLLFGTGI